MAYILNTDEDVRQMLSEIGVSSVDELFDSAPASVRLQRPLAIERALGELELSALVGELAGKNQGSDKLVCFLGGGSYDHFIPAVVDSLASRGEFYTAYTPYQAEASQGTLQATFEYQTLVCQLTGLDVSNASLYDGGSAVAEAAVMALAASGDKSRLVVLGTCHPEHRSILRTYLANFDLEIVEVAAKDGRIEPAALEAVVDSKTAAVLIQQPNFFGQIEDAAELIAIAHKKKALAIVSFDPISMGLLERPGDLGADIAIAEGQSLGIPLQYGGPYLGIMACREEFVRKMPGRIVGETTDANGKRAWVLTLQTREQHIRRQKATSNICTNEALLALRASIYLAVVGPSGLRRAAELSTQKAHYAALELAKIKGLELAYSGPFFKEFVIRSNRNPKHVLAEVRKSGFHGGIALGGFDPKLADSILIAVTEKRTKSEIDGLVRAYKDAVETA